MVGVIGPQENIPVLPTSEARQRFESVFVAFCQVFFSSYTVVLFLDGKCKYNSYINSFILIFNKKKKNNKILFILNKYIYEY